MIKHYYILRFEECFFPFFYDAAKKNPLADFFLFPKGIAGR